MQNNTVPDKVKSTISGLDLRSGPEHVSIFTDFVLSPCVSSFSSETNMSFNGLLLDTVHSGFSYLLVWFSQSDPSELPIECPDLLDDGSSELITLCTIISIRLLFEWSKHSHITYLLNQTYKLQKIHNLYCQFIFFNMTYPTIFELGLLSVTHLPNN